MQTDEEREILGDGRNKDAAPVEPIWVEDYSMMVPVCPKCREVCYENTYCVFCGQPFKVHIPTEEEKRQAFEDLKRRIEGATWNEDKQFFACNKCGSDIEKTCSMIGFFDGVKGGGRLCQCKCGNAVHIWS